MQHIVVIYQENHSFDNLYGGWQDVDGLARRRRRRTRPGRPERRPRTTACCRTTSTSTSPPLPARCTDTRPSPAFTSWFTNKPFQIDDFIGPMDTTCPAPGASGNAAQGHGAARRLHARPRPPLLPGAVPARRRPPGPLRDRLATPSAWSWAPTTRKALPIYSTCTRRATRATSISDRFFQAAFGGSFLNHQWLVAAATPTWPSAVADGGADDLHSLVDANGMPINVPALHADRRRVKDAALTVACSSPHAGAACACGDWAVNTIQPPYQPFAPGTAESRRLPPQTAPTIGDRLTDAGVDWAWYSGGWSNANGDVGAPGWTNGTTPGTCTDPDTDAKAVYPNCPSKLFQYHHQPLNYFATFAPGTAGAARAPARRGGVRVARRRLEGRLRAQAGPLHQAGRLRERAPGLRQRARRAPTTSSTCSRPSRARRARRTRWSS